MHNWYTDYFICSQIKRYYSFKVKHHKQYDGLIPSKEQNIFNQNILAVLPVRDQLGRRILVLELGSAYILDNSKTWIAFVIRIVSSSPIYGSHELSNFTNVLDIAFLLGTFL